VALAGIPVKDLACIPIKPTQNRNQLNMDKPAMDKPVTTWKELRQKIESQNKQISLENKELSLLLQSMRQEREERRQKREERRQKGEQREQRLLSAVLQMESRLKSQNKKTN
jgi:hypothetical protein